MFGRVGPMEIGVIIFLALLIFGPRQLPKLGKSLGDTIREMRGIGKELHGNDEEDSDGPVSR